MPKVCLVCRCAGCYRGITLTQHCFQVPEPHEDFGDWWTLYDYGPETVKNWKKGCVRARMRFANSP